MSRAVARLIFAWMGLMLLLGLTVGAAFLPLGPAKPGIAYTIAAAKAALILWFFMELRAQSGIARLAALAGFLWLLIMLVLTSADYLTRSWIS